MTIIAKNCPGPNEYVVTNHAIRREKNTLTQARSITDSAASSHLAMRSDGHIVSQNHVLKNDGKVPDMGVFSESG